MSEDIGVVVDPDLAPAPAEPVAEIPPEPQAAAPDPDVQVEDDPDVHEAAARDLKVAGLLGAVKALRGELKQLKPQAQRVSELERESAENRAIVEFLKANPHLMQPQQPQAPAAPPGDDPALVEYARTLDLYTQDGRPDVTRAAKLRDMTRAETQTAVQQAMAPMQEATHAQAAAQNLQWMTSLKDANGRGLEEQYIIETVRTVYGNLPKADAVKVLADPKVAEVLAYTALGRQAASKPSQAAPAAPAAPVLHVESAGGNVPFHVSEDHTKRLGGGHKQYVESAKRYVPGKSNVLE